VCIDSGEERRANAVEAILFVRYVVVRAAIAKFFGESKVDYIDHAGSAACAHDEVCGLDIAMYEGVGVDEFDARNLETRRVRVGVTTRL
jgi:hypothetical protein